MKIKRKLELSVTTSRRYIIRQSPSIGKTTCAKCGEAMLMTEQAAVFFGIGQRLVFQIIETGAAHFAENETGATMICLSSLAIVLDGESQKKTKFTAK